MNRFTTHPDLPQIKQNALGYIAALPDDKRFVIEIKPYRKRRTNDQNAYLWGVVYPAFTDVLEGWESQDVHEYLLGEHFGWERIEGMGRARIKPVRRSSKLDKSEFAEFVDFCIRKGAEHGILVPEPEAT